MSDPVRSEEQVEEFGKYVQEKAIRVMHALGDSTGKPEWVSLNEGFMADLNVLTNIIATGLCMLEEKSAAVRLLTKVSDSVMQALDARHGEKEPRHEN